MRIVIFGAHGQLGQALLREAKHRGLDCHGVGRAALDITNDVALVECITSLRPEVVVNCVADVSLPNCEQGPASAYLVNARPLSVLSKLAFENGYHLVQISTDHYFHDSGRTRHTEESPVKLFNEYARTKFAGEAFALTDPGACVIRTNIVGFRGLPHRPTFAEWVFSSLEEGLPMTLFDDYFSSSIDVSSFALALFDLLPKRPSGILNLASSEVSSKKEFILALQEYLGIKASNLSDGSVTSLTGVQRACSCGLDVSKAESLLGRALPDLKAVTKSLVSEYHARRARAL